MKRTLQGCVLLASLVALGTPAARADEAFTKDRMTLNVTAGFGFATQGDALGNPYNVSLGAGAGYTLGGLYLGAMADYFIGDTTYEADAESNTVRVDYDWSHMAFELGVDVAARSLVLRPSIGVGVGIAGLCRDDACDSESYPLFAPGLSGLAPLGSHSFFTFSVRYLVVPGRDNVDPYDGLMFGVGLGAAVGDQRSASTPGPATPVTANLSVSANVGYAASTDGSDLNAFGPGFGLRGGYTFGNGLHVGAFANYFIGDSETVGDLELTGNVLQVGADLGYDLAVEQVVLRPSLGLGGAFVSASVKGTIPDPDGEGVIKVDDDESEQYLLLAPGAQILYPIGSLFVGGDFRYLWTPDDRAVDAFLLAATVGLQL